MGCTGLDWLIHHLRGKPIDFSKRSPMLSTLDPPAVVISRSSFMVVSQPWPIPGSASSPTSSPSAAPSSRRAAPEPHFQRKRHGHRSPTLRTKEGYVFLVCVCVFPRFCFCFFAFGFLASKIIPRPLNKTGVQGSRICAWLPQEVVFVQKDSL